MIARVAIAREHVGQRSGTPARAQLVARSDRAIGPRSVVVRFERPIVMHDDDAVAREADVELEAVGAERQAVVERGDRVLRRERAAAAMREHQGPRRGEEGMTHGWPV